MTKVLIDDVSTSSTDAVISGPYRPIAGAVTTSFLVFSSAVAGTVVVEVEIGGGPRWVPYVTEAVQAGVGKAIVTDVPLPQRLRFTPGAATTSTLRAIAVSAGQT